MPNRQSDGTRINEDIRISPIRLVKEDGEAVIMDTKQALQMAKDAGLDLVEVSPNAKPPVDTVIVYVTSAYNNNGSQFEQESTWEVPFANREFGTPRKLFNGAYHGGISDDERLAVSGSTRLRARVVSESGEGQDVIWYNEEQACNVSLSKDGSKRTLFLDFGTDTDVPTAQVGAVGCTTLVVSGEVYAHGLVARENQAEACADQECRDKEGNGRVAKSENKVGDHVQSHAGSH